MVLEEFEMKHIVFQAFRVVGQLACIAGCVGWLWLAFYLAHAVE